MKLSVLIITFNEERNIERCLRSVLPVADEIVVVDSFSMDKTREICQKHGVRFIEHPFEGHIQQKNYAISCAENDFILSLDADEALTEELTKSILAEKENGFKDGYKMNRLTNYCGHWVKHCGWYPDTKVRLINRRKGSWQGVNPHDRLDLEDGSEIGHFSGDLLHYSYYTKEDHYKQIEYFGKIAANELLLKGKKTNPIQISLKVLAQLFKSIVLKSAYLDGVTGWKIAYRSAYATYRKYKILWDLQA